MPYRITYDNGARGVTTTFYGVLTDDDLIKSCIDRTSSDDKITDLLYIEDDLLEVTEFKASTEGIKECALFADRASELNKKLVHIAIASEDIIYGMTRMWQAYADDTGWNMNIVRTREDAEIWLKDNIQKT